MIDLHQTSQIPPEPPPYLSVHNNDSSFFKFFEILVPYMLTYQSNTEDACTFFNLSPCSQNRVTISKKDNTTLDVPSLHSHDFFEVMFVISGTVRQRLEGKNFSYSAGECCILNKNIRHQEDFSTDFEVLFLALTDKFLNQLMEHDIQYSPNEACWNYFGSIYHLIEQNHRNKYYNAKEYIDFRLEAPLDSNNELMTHFHILFNELIKEISMQRPGSNLIVEGLIARFFSMLEEKPVYESAHIKLSSTKEQNLLHKISHILEEKHGRISRNELVKLLNYNGDYLNRIVKKQTGMTLTEYGRLFCLENAANQLLHSQKTISQIVTELGFSNRNYFNHIFIEKYGISPNEFRKQKNVL